MPLGIPKIDENKITELYEGDYGIYLPVLRAYIDELPKTLGKLRGVSAATLQDYAKAMHSVKGTSASACAEEARKRALELETLAKAGDIGGVLAKNESFLKYMDDLSAVIRNWLLKNPR